MCRIKWTKSNRFMIVGFLDYVRFEPLNSKGMKISIFLRNHNYIIAHKKSASSNEKQCSGAVFIITNLYHNLPHALSLYSVNRLLY